MNIKWLLENDVFDENLDPLIAEIKNQGMEVHVHQQIPFGADEEFLNIYSPNDCVIFHGSLQFAKQIRQKSQWIPGLFCTLPNFECTYYYPPLRQFILNDKYVMLPYGDLNNRKEFLLDTVGNNGCVFVRPNSGNKVFTGQVVANETWEKDVELLGFYGAEPQELCIVAEPQNITQEWRLLVYNDTIIAQSEYEPNKTTNVPDKVVLYGQEIAAVGFEPDSVWTMDICQLKNGDLRLLEIGSFSCAGMYECDVKNIVKYVSEAAWKEWEEYNTIC